MNPPASSLPRPEPSLPRTESVRGFGTLIEHEGDLLTLMRQVIDQAHGPGRAGLIRILRHDEDEINRVLALIRARQRELPAPDRFATAWTPPASTDGSGLVERHRHLAHDFEVLMDHGGRSVATEPLLREARHRHEEMAWMLASLLAEDGGQAGGVSLASSGDTLGAERRWEDDGGRR